jgi:two-component system sensor histidine kinase KdpD
MFTVTFLDAPRRYDRVLVTWTDITARKRAEEELKEAAALKDQFLSLVSHELRTPISTVISNGALLLRRGQMLQESDRQQALSDIVSEGRRLQSIIENLLLLTRIESSGPELRPISLQDVIAGQVEAFARRSPGRQINVLDEGDRDMINGQETLIAMLVENLISNADKYSPPASPIEVLLRTSDEHEAEVHVRDTGIGVSETELPNLFTPFYRTTTARKYARGMGLGLAVCKRIVEAHGGRIWVTRRPEGGSDFAFSMPLSETRDPRTRDAS